MDSMGAIDRYGPSSTSHFGLLGRDMKRPPQAPSQVSGNVLCTRLIAGIHSLVTSACRQRIVVSSSRRATISNLNMI